MSTIRGEEVTSCSLNSKSKSTICIICYDLGYVLRYRHYHIVDPVAKLSLERFTDVLSPLPVDVHA
jgi:hypothetical protein